MDRRAAAPSIEARRALVLHDRPLVVDLITLNGTPAARPDAHIRRLSGETSTAPLTRDPVIPLSRMDDRAS